MELIGPTLKLCFRLSMNIVDICAQSKLKRRRCKMLSDIIEDVMIPLEKLEEYGEPDVLRFLERLRGVLEEAEDLVSECQSMGSVKAAMASAFMGEGYSKRFDDIEKKLLMLTLPATLIAMSENVRHGELTQSAMEEMGEQLNRVESLESENAKLKAQLKRSQMRSMSADCSYGEEEETVEEDSDDRRFTISVTDREELMNQLFPGMTDDAKAKLVTMIPDHIFSEEVGDENEDDDDDEGEPTGVSGYCDESVDADDEEEVEEFGASEEEKEEAEEDEEEQEVDEDVQGEESEEEIESEDAEDNGEEEVKYSQLGDNGEEEEEEEDDVVVLEDDTEKEEIDYNEHWHENDDFDRFRYEVMNADQEHSESEEASDENPRYHNLRL